MGLRNRLLFRCAVGTRGLRHLWHLACREGRGPQAPPPASPPPPRVSQGQHTPGLEDRVLLGGRERCRQLQRIRRQTETCQEQLLLGTDGSCFRSAG